MTLRRAPKNTTTHAYALQLGFSVKKNTSRKSVKTAELIKQQFVCNKFRKPKVDDGGAERIPSLDKIVEQGENIDEEDVIVFLDDESKLK